ncbi:C-type lectin domain family 12 member B [Dissostichus eleginoides]|uniref:C-type lectin domain family 12 member B n=1 Tax=Dissostichus eleginoides TaxID=100907 RepID=A0AAD9EXI7_DISEL|nr:C-type lectin domain family 12 member B [Dissostichus eleginoides]
MSDIYAKPDLSKKVIFTRKLQGDNGQWEEREVDIYESADAVGEDHPDHRSQQVDPAQRRTYRAAALCLGVLCILMITAIIALSIHFTLEKEELRTRNEHLNKNYSQLLDKVADLSVNNSELQDEVKQLKVKIEGKVCPGGWKRFGCSCYFKSNERKSWYDSRYDCQQRGADLVVINNKEEQKFLIELNEHGEFWIGLKASKRTWTSSGWVNEWEWVDGSPLTEMFQESGLPLVTNHNTAAYSNQHGQWTQSMDYYYYKNWICEK